MPMQVDYLEFRRQESRRAAFEAEVGRYIAAIDDAMIRGEGTLFRIPFHPSQSPAKFDRSEVVAALARAYSPCGWSVRLIRYVPCHREGSFAMVEVDADGRELGEVIYPPKTGGYPTWSLMRHGFNDKIRVEPGRDIPGWAPDIPKGPEFIPGRPVSVRP